MFFVDLANYEIWFSEKETQRHEKFDISHYKHASEIQGRDVEENLNIEI